MAHQPRLDNVIHQLRLQRDRLEAQVAHFEAVIAHLQDASWPQEAAQRNGKAHAALALLRGTSEPVAAPEPAKNKPARTMSPAMRKKISKRMKERWAQKSAEQRRTHALLMRAAVGRKRGRPRKDATIGG